MSNIRKSTYRMAGLAILTAIIIVLQVFTTFVRFGPFSITLALIPIVIGAAMYGPGAGAYLGAVFGVIVIVMCITGGDVGGAMVWNASPWLCILVCMLKGTLAGFEAGVHYTALNKAAQESHSNGKKPNDLIAIITAALVSPIVNTGVFLLGLVIFFKDILTVWAGGSDLIYYIIFGLTGVNFLVEISVNIVLSPVVLKIIEAVKKSSRKV